MEDGKMEKVDLDRSPSPQDDKSAPYSPVYNGKASGSMSPDSQPEADVKSVEVSEKPKPASPVRQGKSRDDDEEGIIDEDGEIAEDDPRSTAAKENGDN